MSILSRYEERKALVEAGMQLKAAGLDVTKPDLIDRLTNGGSLQVNPDGSVQFLSIARMSYARMYEIQSAFRSVVDFMSRNVAAIHMKLSEEASDGSRRPRSKHPMMRVIEHPSPGVSYSKLMRGIIGDKMLYDCYAVWKIRENFSPTPNSQGFVPNSGKVVGLVRIPIPYISISKLSLTAPLRFVLNAGTPINIRPEDIIWGTGYSPTSNITGTPPAETLRQILAEEYAAGKNQENQWKRGAHGNSVFVQKGIGLDPTAASNFKTDWRQRYGGVGADQAGEIPLLPADIDLKNVVLDAQNMQYLQTRNLAREEVCREYGFNPAILGITPSNFASADAFHQMLYQDALTPVCIPIQEDFEEQLLFSDFEDIDSGFALDFNINAKLQGSFLDQAKIGQQAVGGPWMTADEFRQKFQGLGPLPDGQGSQLITPSNVVKGGGPQANPQDAQNQHTNPQPTDQIKAEDIEGVLRLAHRREEA